MGAWDAGTTVLLNAFAGTVLYTLGERSAGAPRNAGEAYSLPVAPPPFLSFIAFNLFVNRAVRRFPMHLISQV